MHQSFTDALVEWFYNNFPIIADSFRLVFIHCVARALGLGATVQAFCTSVPHRAVVPIATSPPSCCLFGNYVDHHCVDVEKNYRGKYVL